GEWRRDERDGQRRQEGGPGHQEDGRDRHRPGRGHQRLLRDAQLGDRDGGGRFRAAPQGDPFRPGHAGGDRGGRMTAETPPELEGLLDYLKRTRGFDFTSYKRSTLMRRIQKRMQVVGISDFTDYVDYLEVHPEEFPNLFNTILINVTAFFRDPGAWEFVA